MTESAARRGRRTGMLAFLLVALLVASAELGVLVVSSGARDWSVAAATTGLLTYAAMLITCLLLYVSWRLTADEAVGWLVAGLGAMALPVVGVFGLRLGDETHRGSIQAWQSLLSVITVMVLLSMVAYSRHHRLLFDPLALGTVLGLGLGIARYLVALSAAQPELSGPARMVLAIGLVAGVAVLAAACLRLRSRPFWLRSCLATSVLLLGLGMAAVYVDADHTAFSAVSMIANLGAAMLAMTAGAILLRDAVQANQQRRDELSRRLEEVEAAERLDRERMHEIGSVVAGIASASRLVRRSEVERSRARQLEEMLDSEMARLERLIEEKPLAMPERFDLDTVIGALVTAQRVQGRQVGWEPSGRSVVVSPDVVAEAVSVLLENAARHAPGAPVSVIVSDAGGRLQVVVTDRGPGVPETVRDRLFAWEARGPGSPGQGIGLNIARRLLTEAGGDLEHRSGFGAGATFVISLPPEAATTTSLDAFGPSHRSGRSAS